jgi:hypothetical protein
MLPMATNENGAALAVPDVCFVPVPAPPGRAPVPFSNTARLCNAARCTTKVRVRNKGACVEDSKIPISSDDEPGTGGGVVSGVNLGEVSFAEHSSKVKLEGRGAVRLTARTKHNKDNAPVGVLVAPSQSTVFVGG